MYKCVVHFLAAYAAVLTTMGPAAAQAPGRAETLGFKRVTDPAGRFAVEVPRRDWQARSGLGSSLLTMVQKNGDAMVTIEQMLLPIALDPEDVGDLFVELESDITSTRHPDGTRPQRRLLEQDGRRVVVTDFDRRGINGLEHVRQYTFVAGQMLYRLICGASVTGFGRYEATFTQIARSFEPSRR